MAILNKQSEIEVVGRERLTPAVEVAKKFVSPSMSRPSLTYLELRDNGEVRATDSHRMIILKDIHLYKETILLNPKTLDLVKGLNYPDLRQLCKVHEEHVQAKFQITKETAFKLIPALKFFNTKTKDFRNNDVRINFVGDNIELSCPDTELVVKDLDIKLEQLKEISNLLTVNTKYMIEALEAFVKFSSAETINVHHQGALRPFLMTNDEMEMLILPIRTY